MTESSSDIVTCRLCDAPVARDADVCPSCGVKAPWISDEPTLDPRVIRVATWGGGIAVAIILLFVAGMLAFGPAADDDERDDRPPGVGVSGGGARP